MKSYYDDQPINESNQTGYGVTFRPSILQKMEMIKLLHEVVLEYEFLMKFYQTHNLVDLEMENRLNYLEVRIGGCL